MIKKEIQQLFELGKKDFIEKRYEDAIYSLEKIIDIYNKDLVFYSDNEYIIYNEDDTDNIHALLANTYYNIGASKHNLKNYNEAIEYFNKTLELDSSFFDVYYSRGVAEYHLKFYENAVSDFTKALEVNPNLQNAYYIRALCYAKINKHKKAIEDFDILLNSFD
ncbi:tetratricopeptide repeat protein [uncultured Brachyspira sp.]|uniref:tetratricopeptide repeat protein n=1 Tax=uncultured Brachyspira sp. TaxID=221953 RepID=UPI00263976CE|nr:tetratricopeptide repeat protein [uncultured Brachyspira sp.]